MEALSCKHCCCGRAIFWVCVCILRYPACNAHEPYCYLWFPGLYRIFPHYLIKDTIFDKDVIDYKLCVLIFYTTSVWNISHSKKSWARYDKKCKFIFMWSTRYYCPNLMKQFPLQNFEKYSHFMKMLSVGAELIDADRRTDGRMEQQTWRSW